MDRYPVSLAALTSTVIFSPNHCSWCPRYKAGGHMYICVTIYVCVFLWILFFLPLVYVSTLIQKSHCLKYYGATVGLAIWLGSPSNLFFWMALILFGFWCPYVFQNHVVNLHLPKTPAGISAGIGSNPQNILRRNVLI